MPQHAIARSQHLLFFHQSNNPTLQPSPLTMPTSPLSSPPTRTPNLILLCTRVPKPSAVAPTAHNGIITAHLTPVGHSPNEWVPERCHHDNIDSHAGRPQRRHRLPCRPPPATTSTPLQAAPGDNRLLSSTSILDITRRICRASGRNWDQVSHELDRRVRRGGGEYWGSPLGFLRPFEVWALRKEAEKVGLSGRRWTDARCGS